jgi:hypothetical protein
MIAEVSHFEFTMLQPRGFEEFLFLYLILEGFWYKLQSFP